MRRSCDACGKGYEAQRSTSKYCSPSCRSRVSQGQVSVAPVPASSLASPAEVTERRLLEVGRLDTVAGQYALFLAQRIESAHDSAVAALSKELRAVLAEALEGTAKAADPMDELKARRERSHAG